MKDSSFYKRTEITFDNRIPTKMTNSSSNVRHQDSVKSDLFTDDKRTSTLHFFETDLFATKSSLKGERPKPRVLHQPKKVSLREVQHNFYYYND